MDPVTPSPELLVAGFLAFLVALGAAAAAVLGLARRRGWIESWRHPLGEPPTHV